MEDLGEDRMANFGDICYGLLNLSKVRGFPTEFPEFAALAFKGRTGPTGAHNFSKVGTDPARSKDIRKSLGAANAVQKSPQWVYVG